MAIPSVLGTPTSATLKAVAGSINLRTVAGAVGVDTVIQPILDGSDITVFPETEIVLLNSIYKWYVVKYKELIGWMALLTDNFEDQFKPNTSPVGEKVFVVELRLRGTDAAGAEQFSRVIQQFAQNGVFMAELLKNNNVSVTVREE